MIIAMIICPGSVQSFNKLFLHNHTAVVSKNCCFHIGSRTIFFVIPTT